MKTLLGSCMVFLVLASHAAKAQHTPNSATQTYLEQASQVLFQRTAGATPFRLKSSFTATAPSDGDKQGVPQEGTYEETWMSPSLWRRDITLGSVKVAFGRSDGRNWQTLPAEQVPAGVYASMECILPTVAFAQLNRVVTGWKHTSKIKLSFVHIGSVELARIGSDNHEPSHGKRNASESAYYFVPDSHLLLSIASGTHVIDFKKSAAFGDKKVLMSGTDSSMLLPRVEFSIESMESAPAEPESFFAAPQGSEVSPISSDGDNEFLPAHCVRCQQPIYPSIARSTNTQGTVVVAALIDQKGQLSKVRVLSGPPVLRQAVIDGLHAWTFTPASSDGIAIPVETIIETTFSTTRG